jgi:hypothetical protein
MAAFVGMPVVPVTAMTVPTVLMTMPVPPRARDRRDVLQKKATAADLVARPSQKTTLSSKGT